MKNYRIGFLLLLLPGLIITGSASGDDVGRGGDAGAFLRMGVGARAMGMGGGSVSFLDGANTAFYNPGGLGYIKNKWATGSVHVMPLNRTITYLGYAQPLRRGEENQGFNGGFSVSWLSAGIADIDGRDFSGMHTDMISTAEHAYYFSLAVRPLEMIAVGFNAKLVNHRYPQISGDNTVLSAVGFGFDFGVMVRPIENLSLGVVVRDLRTGYTWDTQNFYDLGTQTVDDFPLVVRTGISYRFLKGRLLTAFDAEKVEGREWRFMGGVESGSYHGAFVRAGFRYSNLTFGAGYRKVLGDFTFCLDYALLLDSIAPGSNHLFTWSMFF